MWPYYPELLETPVPRYTSYPTAADFGDIAPHLFPAAVERAEGDVSLYVHIPFCDKICHYCGCNTAAAGRRHRLDSYLAALTCEIEAIAALLPQQALVRRVSFGGGSPNALDPVDFARLVDRLTIAFHLSDPDFSIELDPRAMTADWARTIGRIGISRASLGVQTFAAHCQQAIGRVQDEELIVRTVDWLRNAGVTSLNFDLMYGLPGQTAEDLVDTLHRTRVLGADRVALFGYAHVPHIVPRQRMIDASALPGREDRFAFAQLGYSYLCTHGYVPVGFDHFAKPGGDPLAHAMLIGQVRRNFQGFTDEQAPNLIGLGASAISMFPNLIAQNEKNGGRYRMLVSQGRLAICRGVERDGETRRRANVIEQLLCQGRAKIPQRLLAEANNRLQPFIDRELASIDAGWLTVMSHGLPYARAIAAQFDSYRPQSDRRFSAAI